MGRITNLIPSHVSIVDKAANKRSFLLMKSDQQPNVETDVRLLKRDEAQQIVYGVVYEPDVVDAHGDFMDAEEIEKAAHVFLKEFRNIDKQHDFTSKVGEVIESYIAPADFEFGGQTVTKGTWMMAVKVVDDVWTGIQKGEFTGFSLAGYGNVEKAQETPQEPSGDAQTEAGFMKMMKQFFQRFTKGEVRDEVERERPSRDLKHAIWRFSEIVDVESWVPKMDRERVQSALDDLNAYATAFINSPVTKAEEPQGEEVMTMTKEELQAVVDEAVEKAVTKALAKQEAPAEPASPQDEPEAVAEDVVKEETPAEETTEQTELAKAMQEIEELKKQLDARPVAFSSGAEVVSKASDKPNYCKFV